MPKKPQIRIKITPKGLRSRWKKVGKDYGTILDEATVMVSTDAAAFMKSIVPVRSGRLRDSIRSFGKTRKGGGWDRRVGINVGPGPELQYATYVDKGTSSSPGRYVPSLGRRVEDGTHPGFKGREFIKETEEHVAGQQTVVQKKIDKDLGKAINRRLRG